MITLMIESKQNKQFKLWKKLKLKKYRDSSDMFLVYGKHIVDKAREKRSFNRSFNIES